MKREQDSILASFQPYFQLDKNTEKEVIKKLKNDYQTHLRDVLPSTDYIRHIEKILSEVYRAGILSTEELGQLHKDSTSAIMVINDKLASQRDIDKLYSVKQAYAYLLTADTMHYQPNILRQCSLNEYLSPNLTYDVQRTETAKKEVLDNYSWANGIVLSGQKIIDRGEIVNQETYNILESLRKESIQRSESIGQKRLMLAGQVLYVSIFMLCFMLYLDLFRKDYYNRKGSLSLLFALIMFYCVVTAIMVANNIFNVYIIPYAMLPIIIRVFLDSRTAFLTQVVTILICSICLRYPHEFILLQLTAGLIAIFSLRELSQRSQLFRTAILVILTYMAVYFALTDNRERSVETKWQHVHLLHNKRRVAALYLSAAFPGGKDFRLHIERHFSGTVQHQQQPIAAHVGNCTGHVPALHAGGQPCRRSRQPHRSEKPVGAYGSPIP